MQPLKLLALVIGALPIAAFLLTLYLTQGAPLKPLTPGEESGPVAATRALPQATPERPPLERQGSVAAAGNQGNDERSVESTRAEAGFPPETTPVVNQDRDS